MLLQTLSQTKEQPSTKLFVSKMVHIHKEGGFPNASNPCVVMSLEIKIGGVCVISDGNLALKGSNICMPFIYPLHKSFSVVHGVLLSRHGIYYKFYSHTGWLWDHLEAWVFINAWSLAPS